MDKIYCTLLYNSSELLKIFLSPLLQIIVRRLACFSKILKNTSPTLRREAEGEIRPLLCIHSLFTIFLSMMVAMIHALRLFAVNLGGWGNRSHFR